VKEAKKWKEMEAETINRLQNFPKILAGAI